MKHLSAFAKVNPDKIAYQMAGSGEKLTYGELDARSNKGAQALRSLDVQQGESIALMFENRLDILGLAWAAQRSGIFYTAISHHLSEAEVAFIVNDCGAKVLILSDRFAAMLPGLRAACPKARVFISGQHDVREDHWQSLESDIPDTPIADEALGTDVLYSSGTTGRPKGITRAYEPLPIDTVMPPLMTVLCEVMGKMDENTLYLSPAPLYHAAPLRFSMRVIMLGGTVLIMEKFDAETMLSLIEEHRVTHTQVVPTMFVRMLKLDKAVREGFDVSSLKWAYHAAAPCPQEVKRRMIDWWGPILIEYYAGSEANGVTISTSPEWRQYPGTVGKSLLGDILILDSEGAELPPGQIGAVYFDSGIDFQYRNDPDKTASAYHRPGCSTLGDVGYVNEEGYLFLTDRASYTIISGGVNIYPQETEDLLVCHPDVADVAVFGVPSEEMGEEVKAVVQLEPGVTASPDKARELIEWCHTRIAKLKAPRSIDFRDELPRTPTGKLIKRKLKDEYWPDKTKAIA